MYEPDSSSSSHVSSTSSPNNNISIGNTGAASCTAPSINNGITSSFQNNSPTTTMASYTNGNSTNQHGGGGNSLLVGKDDDDVDDDDLMMNDQMMSMDPRWLTKNSSESETFPMDDKILNELPHSSKSDAASSQNNKPRPANLSDLSTLGQINNEQQQQQPEQSSNLSSTQNLSPTKIKPPKLCQVCGDKAKSFHFGGLSCDSCKAFFRRSVHNDAHKSFQCVYKLSCEINISSRKSCQFCRFKKCLSIGMEMNWVMKEDERSQLQKQRIEKKEASLKSKDSALKYVDQSNSNNNTTSNASTSIAAAGNNDDFEPNVADMLNYMTVEERDEIESIVNKYQYSYREIPFRVANMNGTRNSVEIIQMFTTILRRFAYFTKLIPEFSGLSVNDQSTLLRASVLEMCLLRSALAFDLKNNRWPKTENMEFLKDCPQLRVEDMEKLVSKDLYHMHMQFINGIQELKVDEPTVMILLLIVLFYPERGPLDQHDLISKIQEKYLLLLNKYVQWRFGGRCNKIFPKLLTRLADLRQLNDFHTEYNLKMTKTEVEEIQEQLGTINLNPYPQWVLVEDQQQLNTSATGPSSDGTQTSTTSIKHVAHAYAASDHHHDEQDHYTPDMARKRGKTETKIEGYDDVPMQGDEQQQQQQQLYYHHQQPRHPTGNPFPVQFQQPPPSSHQFHQLHAPSLAGPPQLPSMRQLFMQFVNQKIPTLIANPFATFPMENEMAAGAAAFFEQMGASSLSGVGGGGQHQAAAFQALLNPGAAAGLLPTHHHDVQNPLLDSPYQHLIGRVDSQGSQGLGLAGVQQQHSTSAGISMSSNQSSPSGGQGIGQLSQISSLLESTDPNTLRQLKETLNPDVVAKLSSVFGGGGSGGVQPSGGSTGFDFSKISPEIISSFMTGGVAAAAAALAPPMADALAYQHVLPPYVNYNSNNGGANNTTHPTSNLNYGPSQSTLDGYHHLHPQIDMSGNWPQQHQLHQTSPSTNEPPHLSQSQPLPFTNEHPGVATLHYRQQQQQHFPHTPSNNGEPNSSGYSSNNSNNHHHNNHW